MGLKDKVQQGDVTSASWANVTMADGILEALFELEFGHADVADDADFLQLIYHPSRFTGKKRVNY